MSVLSLSNNEMHLQ